MSSLPRHAIGSRLRFPGEGTSVAPAAPSSIAWLSTRDVAPADRLSYASWILSSSLAPSALSTATPSEYELEVTALELPSIAIVAQRFAAALDSCATRNPSHCSALLLPGPGSQRLLARREPDAHAIRSRRPDLLRFARPARLRFAAQLERLEPAAVGTVRAQMGSPSCCSHWAEHLPRIAVGRLLASYVAQLAPEFVVHAPLPQAALIDQLGRSWP